MPDTYTGFSSPTARIKRLMNGGPWNEPSMVPKKAGVRDLKFQYGRDDAPGPATRDLAFKFGRDSSPGPAVVPAAAGTRTNLQMLIQPPPGAFSPKKLEGGMANASRQVDYPAVRNQSSGTTITPPEIRPAATGMGRLMAGQGAMPAMPSGPAGGAPSAPAMSRAPVQQYRPAMGAGEYSMGRLTKRFGPAGGDTSAVPPGHPLFGLSSEAQRQVVAGMRQRASQPVPSSREFAQQNGYQFPQQPSQADPAAPAGPTAWERVTNGTNPNLQYSGSGREGARRDADGLVVKQPMARNREGILARINGGAGVSLEQAANDPNFNADGRFFQGAKLGQDRNGRAYFREGPKPTDFAGTAKTADEATLNRLRGMSKLQQREVGQFDPETGAFMGYGNVANRTGLQGNSMETLRGRLAAGGVTNSTLTPEQLAANAQGMKERLAAGRSERMGRVMQLAQQREAARNQPQGGGMNPMIAQLMQRRPELAVALLGQQQQGAIAQAELGLRQGQLGLEGRRIDQQGQLAKAQMDAAEAQLGLEGRRIDQQGQLAKAQMDAAEAQLGRKLSHDEKLALAAQQQAKELQQGELGFREKALGQQGEMGKAELAQQAELAAMNDKTKQAQIAAIERAANAEGQAKIQGGMVGAVLADESLPLEERLQAAQQLAGQKGAAAAAVPGPQGGLLGRLSGPKTFAGNTLNESQMKQVEGIDDPVRLRDKLASFGLTPEQQTIALNSIMPPSGIYGLIGRHTRSADVPTGWGNIWRGKSINPKTGREYNYLGGK